jgi:hypothetical protein
MDPAMGRIYKIMTEWNLRDIMQPGADYLLELLKHHAAKSLTKQYLEGVNSGSGDAEFI